MLFCRIQSKNKYIFYQFSSNPCLSNIIVYILSRTWAELPSSAGCSYHYLDIIYYLGHGLSSHLPPGCSYHYPDIIYYLGHGLSSHLPPGCSYHYPDIIYYLGHGFSSHLPPGCSYHYLDGSTLVERISRILGWNKFNLIGKIIVKSLYTTF